MEVSSLTQTQSTTTASTTTETDSTNTGVISSDFETFLVMLTAQIQNQDPLNPMDSSDYAVQLATFSGVEQQVLTNQLLQSMGATTDGSSLASLASWVGLEARNEGPIAFTGSSVNFSVDVPEGATWAKLIIRDESGKEVTALDATATNGEVTWTGTWEDGTTATTGLYTAELHVYEGGETEPEITDIPTYARIVEMQQSTTGMVALLANGTTMDVEDITALRSPT